MKSPHRLSAKDYSTRSPQKLVFTAHLSTGHWPPPGELEEALRNAAETFVATLKGHLGEKLKGALTCETDASPPNPHLN